MPTEVVMPLLGESVTEGTITKWLKQKGEAVEEYEPLLEVNTDKVDTEVPSPTSGVLLEILVTEGTTVRVGQPLALIGEAGSAPHGGNGGGEHAEVKQPEPVMAQTVSSQPVGQAGTPRAAPPMGRDRDLGFISPVVARIAKEQKVDLYQIQGSGQGGRITKKDVLDYLEQGRSGASTTPETDFPLDAPIQGALSVVEAPVETPPSTTVPQPTPRQAPAPAAPIPQSSYEGMGSELRPMTAVRRSIAEHMVHSKHTSPHVTTVMEVDLSKIVAHRAANVASFKRDGANLTYTAYIIAAIVAALKAYPIVNSSWSDEGVLLHRAINVGMATSLGEAGLIVPVIKHADTLSLLGLARTINDLAARARARNLKPDEVKGGTFTLTNHGISGSLFATPIINQPQCGILGVGAIQKRVVVVEGADGMDSIAIRPMAYVSLTFDHRILDGAIADYFLGKVVESLRNWA